MVNRYILLKIGFILCFSFQSFSQSFEKVEFIQMRAFEFEEIVKNGISKDMTGNFSITELSKGGEVKGIEIKRFSEGKKVGEWISYHNLFSGLKISFVANYKDGVLAGYYFRTDNHTFSEEGYYKKDKRHGYWEISRNDTHENINYKNGLKSGEYSSLDNTSGIKVKGQYKKDKKSGVWVIEDTTIEEVTREVYKDGKLIPYNEQ